MKKSLTLKKKGKRRGGSFVKGGPNPGKKFKPGQSGNPSGRPKNPFPALIREATQDGKLIVDKVLKLFKKTQSEKTLLWCAEFLRDTGWSKPVQGIRGVDEDGNSAPIGIIYEG